MAWYVYFLLGAFVGAAATMLLYGIQEARKK